MLQTIEDHIGAAKVANYIAMCLLEPTFVPYMFFQTPLSVACNLGSSDVKCDSDSENSSYIDPIDGSLKFRKNVILHGPYKRRGLKTYGGLSSLGSSPVSPRGGGSISYGTQRQWRSRKRSIFSRIAIQGTHDCMKLRRPQDKRKLYFGTRFAGFKLDLSS